jgi:hypothetical protein
MKQEAIDAGLTSDASYAKVLRVWRLNESLGYQLSKQVQEIDDIDRAKSWEDFYRKEVLGRKSNHQPDA